MAGCSADLIKVHESILLQHLSRLGHQTRVRDVLVPQVAQDRIDGGLVARGNEVALGFAHEDWRYQSPARSDALK